MNQQQAFISNIHKLAEMLQELVDAGNTVIVIEDIKLDVIKTADWLIDIGPEGEMAAVR